LDLHDQIQIASSQVYSPYDGVVELDIRFPEVESQSAAGRSGQSQRCESHSTSQCPPLSHADEI
jgi:hypothetical protein